MFSKKGKKTTTKSGLIVNLRSFSFLLPNDLTQLCTVKEKTKRTQTPAYNSEQTRVCNVFKSSKQQKESHDNN